MHLLVVATAAVALEATAVSAAATAAFLRLDPTPAVAPEQGMALTPLPARVLMPDRVDTDTLRPSIRRSIHTPRPTTRLP